MLERAKIGGTERIVCAEAFPEFGTERNISATVPDKLAWRNY
jgi:hypothetical protein